MDSIFLLTEAQSQSMGQGDYVTVKNLATYGSYKQTLFPAFLSREDAEWFLLTIIDREELQITELKIKA